MTYSDEYLRAILAETKVIAMLGASSDPARDAGGVMRFLQARGYRVIPVSPKEAGTTMFGETVHRTLADVPVKVDMVDCFRNAAHMVGHAREAVAIGARSLWMQLGVVNDEAAKIATDAGL
jgi:predicted CoA-binding protein